MRKTIFSLFLLGLCFTGNAVAAETKTKASSIVVSLQSTYESVKTFEADFDQVYKSARFEEKKAKGHVWMKKPGLMRWDYSEPRGRVMVSTGRSLTLYDPLDRQALISDFRTDTDLPVPLSFLWGKEKVSAKFTAEWNDKERILSLNPKTPIPNVSEIHLTLKAGEQVLVLASRVVDALGGETVLKFSNIQTNVKVDVKRFAFDLPPNTTKVEIAVSNEKKEK